MKQHLEIEFKNLLTKEEFNRLKDYFSLTDTDFILQQNEYFDTKDFSLKNLGCALRIREKQGSYELTLKEPQDIGLLETNQPLTKEQVNQLLNNQQFPNGPVLERILALNLDANEIIHFGTLSTWRSELTYRNGLLVLDKSHYLGKTDYELEYEVEDPIQGEKEFLQLLSKFSIPKRKSMNKVARFYMAKYHQ